MIGYACLNFWYRCVYLYLYIFLIFDIWPWSLFVCVSYFQSRLVLLACFLVCVFIRLHPPPTPPTPQPTPPLLATPIIQQSLLHTPGHFLFFPCFDISVPYLVYYSIYSSLNIFICICILVSFCVCPLVLIKCHVVIDDTCDETRLRLLRLVERKRMAV